ncbi:MAG: sugar transferase [Myxococcales bacterium]|nr:sugar transferase [Myxococcales bacterium]
MTEQATAWWKRSPQLRMKRAIDIVGAATGLIVAAPIMVATAAAIRSSGPILFSQKRPGYRSGIFTIRKFRTMRAAADGELWFRSDSDRVTAIGHFLRKTSIDELPELWNVLRGDMSLVGPRPLLVEYLEKYTPNEHRRHHTPPGITGWAQVNGRQNIPFSERLRLDVWYVDNWNLLLDCKIIVKTVAAVFLTSHDAVGSDGLDAVDDIGLSSDRERTEVKESA